MNITVLYELKINNFREKTFKVYELFYLKKTKQKKPPKNFSTFAQPVHCILLQFISHLHLKHKFIEAEFS